MPKIREIVVEGYLIPSSILKDFSFNFKYLYINKDYIIFLLWKRKNKTPISTNELNIMHVRSSHKIYRISFVNKKLIPYKKKPKIFCRYNYQGISKIYDPAYYDNQGQIVYAQTIKEYAKVLGPTWYGVSWCDNNTMVE
ncbi:hypothetical protein BCR32DRAFT_284771 [Anaeromyces robustus]|uniref:Uncharacterized protein n=1 Tax=Anaeromyces robustus TaxID=1754192 RepID=A0A1Y1WQR1_9FUNG|nr:hypothetical protein BCR32DRAFT_284771 [Anaeromyces robustus]|eukprot:ORX75873.1 hypothetical protein BCR32DRAFT_284771 [Anaeromyces robustus]